MDKAFNGRTSRLASDKPIRSAFETSAVHMHDTCVSKQLVTHLGVRHALRVSVLSFRSRLSVPPSQRLGPKGGGETD